MSISVEDWDDIAEAPREETRRLGKRRAAKKQAAAEKAQPAPKPKAPAKPAPVARKPAPAPKPKAAPAKPAPAPAPVAQKPAPKLKAAPASRKPAPAPVIEQPAPEPKPAPAPPKSAPVAQKPAPELKAAPVPEAEKPAPEPKPAPVAEKPAPEPKPAPAPVAEKPAPEPKPAPAPVAEKPAPEPKRAPAPKPAPVAQKPSPEPALVAVAEKPAPPPAPEPAPLNAKPAPAPEPELHTPVLAPQIDPDADFFPLDDMYEVEESADEKADAEPNLTPLQRRLRGRQRDAAPAAETWAAYAPEIAPADEAATPEVQETAASVGDWDELSDGKRPGRLSALARTATAQLRSGERASGDFGTAPEENLRLPLCLAAGNILIWLLARLSGVVELIGVSFAASVGMLLAAYVLREWQKDRSALIYLIGALPLPITIVALIT